MSADLFLLGGKKYAIGTDSDAKKAMYVESLKLLIHVKSFTKQTEKYVNIMINTYYVLHIHKGLTNTQTTKLCVATFSGVAHPKYVVRRSSYTGVYVDKENQLME